ncbi:nitroreductase [Phyllobacterium sp. 21LDTY02-6]|uniref:nitroreductase family protein n=1 Tax=unclassified Phyllobacterium TaxID=2638441 RepID=UPI0020227B1A|nr:MULTISPECIES: nitroreductase [unclassified Phyllobacterium]MCO4316764.1 nitroreductase [Phyllobacterium sp. 21LDTY02-6]MCX8281664.1 nitroreductase [Phyllobacterium sp. 0TCS1.6C]MCX8294774.1 nitroreductase [Phyllobacterium sp. 0TCS1.6A]
MSSPNPFIDFLSTRSSTPISAIGQPGPSDDEIRTIVRIASRVPDHGRLTPWRFMLYRGDARVEVGKYLADLAEEREGPLTEQRREQELKRFARAPLVIGVIFTPVEHHIPEWEQFLSSGAAAMKLCLAANALGYATNWITNWYSSDEKGRQLLGLAPHERVTGFVHIGSCGQKVPERPRPEIDAILSEYGGPWKG